jgi:hypothetical protein
MGRDPHTLVKLQPYSLVADALIGKSENQTAKLKGETGSYCAWKGGRNRKHDMKVEKVRTRTEKAAMP